MSLFLTVKDAARKTGKSPSSIRRIIYPILDDDQHPDRHHIEPDVATARELRLKGENFPWKISEEFLNRVIPESPPKTNAEPKSADQSQQQSDVIVEILRKQLDIKDAQIANQNELIKSMSERLREGNILMGSLQQQLAPPKPTAADIKAQPEATREKGSGEPKPHGPIRRILHWKIF